MATPFNIPIYPDEQDIADAITRGSVISSLAQVGEVQPFDIPDTLNKLCASERKNFDLYYLNSLLFSSLWNENDELFLPSEVWHARNTAKDKPVNYEHDCDDIIGHMTNSFVIDDKSNKIDEATELKDLPDLIHVINQAVLYKCWSKDDKQAKMTKLIAEIKNNEWFVSVECLFPDFDYVTKDKNGHLNIIARNKQTAFLTKYLRTFNGEGVYQGNRIGRVPRNFVISAKGIVKQPANKNSVILAAKIDFTKLNPVVVTANLKNLDKTVYNSSEHIEVKKMNDDKTVVQYLEEIKTLKESYSKLQASIVDGETAKIKAELDSTKKVVEAKDQEINALKASAQELNAKMGDTVKANADTVKAMGVLQDAMDKIVIEKKTQERLSAAKTELGLNDEQAVTFIGKVDKLSDDAFKDLVAFQKTFVGSANKVVKTDVVLDQKTADAAKVVVTDPVIIVPAPDKSADLAKLQASVAAYISKNHVKEGVNKFVDVVKK